MDDLNEDLERLQNELAYYKKQVDLHAGNALRDQYALAQLSYDNAQLMRSFQLIADIQRTFSAYSTVDALYCAVLEAMVSLLENDRVVLLKANGPALRPQLWRGFSEDEARELSAKEFLAPEAFYTHKESLMVNSQREPTVFEQELQLVFMSPHFILTPLVKENLIWGALFTGRKYEHKVMSYKSFAKSNIDTLEVIAGMISAFTLQIEKIKQMESERSRIARDMHDDVGAELSRISIACANVKGQYESNPELSEQLSLIQNSSSQLISNIGDIVWALSPVNNNTLSLVGYIREYAYNYLEMNHIFLSFEAPELPLDDEVRHEVRTHLFMVVKECLHNIIKHAAATKVGVAITITNDVFSCTISDNGIGFEINQEPKFGNGLRNLSQRMVEMGGIFNITSKPHAGTMVEFAAPF